MTEMSLWSPPQVAFHSVGRLIESIRGVTSGLWSQMQLTTPKLDIAAALWSTVSASAFCSWNRELHSHLISKSSIDSDPSAARVSAATTHTNSSLVSYVATKWRAVSWVPSTAPSWSLIDYLSIEHCTSMRTRFSLSTSRATHGNPLHCEVSTQ